MPHLVHKSSACPRCSGKTHRTRTPLWLRPLRFLFPGTVTRRCNVKSCRWRGLVYEEPGRTRRAHGEKAA